MIWRYEISTYVPRRLMCRWLGPTRCRAPCPGVPEDFRVGGANLPAFCLARWMATWASPGCRSEPYLNRDVFCTTCPRLFSRFFIYNIQYTHVYPTYAYMCLNYLTSLEGPGWLGVQGWQAAARKSHRPSVQTVLVHGVIMFEPASLQVMAERVISSDLENQRLERNRKNRKRKAGWFNVDLMLCWWCNAFRSVLEGMKSFQISYLWWSLHENIFPHIPIFSQMKLNNWKQGKCCARSALGGEDPDSMTCRHVITWNMSEMFCKDPPLSFFRFYPLVLFLSRASRVLFRKMAFHSCLKCFGHCGMQDPSGWVSLIGLRRHLGRPEQPSSGGFRTAPTGWLQQHPPQNDTSRSQVAMFGWFFWPMLVRVRTNQVGPVSQR